MSHDPSVLSMPIRNLLYVTPWSTIRAQVEDTSAAPDARRGGSFVFAAGKWCASDGCLENGGPLLELSPSQPRCVSAYGAPQLLLSVHLRSPPASQQGGSAGDSSSLLLEVTLRGLRLPVTVTVAGVEAPACGTGHGVRLGPSYVTGHITEVDGLIEAVIEVDLSGSQQEASGLASELVPASAGVIAAGMLRINLWSPGNSDDGGSRLLASERILLLPEGCGTAAEEVAAVESGGSDAQDLITDLALVIETVYISRESGIRPALSTSHSVVLRSMAEDLLGWAVAVDCPATAELLSQCKQLLIAEAASSSLGPPPPEPDVAPQLLLFSDQGSATCPCSHLDADADGEDEAGGSYSKDEASGGSLWPPLGGSCSKAKSEIHSQLSAGGDVAVRPTDREAFHIPVSAAWAGAFVTHCLASCSYQVYRHGFGERSSSVWSKNMVGRLGTVCAVVHSASCFRDGWGGFHPNILPPSPHTLH